MKNLILLFIFTQFQGIYAKSINPIVIDSATVLNKNITYKFTQNLKNIFITVETNDKKASQTILREGLTVYFDVKGKKKKNVFVRYPNKLPKLNRKERQQPQPDSEEEQSNKERLIENLPQEAIYSHFDSQREFHILLNDLDIAVSLDILKHGKVKYILQIPKHRINTDKKKNLNKLSIGVLIGSKKSDSPPNNERSGGQSGRAVGPQGGGPPSGGNSGGGGPPGGGGSGGGGGGGQRSSQNNSPQTSVFWFKTNAI